MQQASSRKIPNVEWIKIAAVPTLGLLTGGAIGTHFGVRRCL
jgi:hypothetical protein